MYTLIIPLFVSTAPLEILIASVFLYEWVPRQNLLHFRAYTLFWRSLLGLSAFAGFGILLAVWPLNTFLTRRSVRIQKGQLAARDKRMGVLSELIKAVSSPVSFVWTCNISLWGKSNLSNFLPGRRSGLVRLWTLERSKWSGWSKVCGYIPICASFLADGKNMLARINSVLFNLLWSSAPILVSIISFMTYVMRGHQLTISKAFTVGLTL